MPDEHWTLVANYALTDAEVTQDTTYEGNTLMGVPRHAGRVWLGYEFTGTLQGLGLGTGVTAVSKQQVDIANSAKTPGFATVDAGAHYAWSGYTVSLGAKNLFDTQYYEPNSYIGGPRVTPGDPLTVVGSIEARF
jgi:iron complex outermembrane receptor protein